MSETKSSSAPDLTISIVSHDNRELLLRCLESLGAACGDEMSAETVVVVNVPGDGSAAAAKNILPEARIIENPRPLGFAANHNTALRGARGRYVAILNDDAIPHPGCLATLVDFMDANPSASAAGPRTLNPDGSLQQSCYRLPSLAVLFNDAFFISSIFPSVTAVGGYKRWPHDAVREVGHVIGACMIVRREAFEAAGGFDEIFFLYFEEADLCKRLGDAGGKVFFVPDAVITHRGGASISRLGPAEIEHFHTSMDYYFEKHFGRASLAAVHALNTFGAAARLMAFAVVSPFSGKFRARTAPQRDRYGKILSWHLSRRPRGKPGGKGL